ncbi:MAG: hypothetical protein N2B06_14910 [Clostridium sp.]
MEYIGILAFILAISNMGVSDKVKKLKAEVNKINSSMKGEKKMSEILKGLEGKRCTLAISFSGTIDCEVISVDDEWMKVNQILKNDQRKIRIIRIENIQDIQHDQSK